MPLKHLLYRCPRCGHDPTEGEGDEARCPGCGTRYTRAGKGARIRVRLPGGEARDVHAAALVERMHGELARDAAGREGEASGQGNPASEKDAVPGNPSASASGPIREAAAELRMVVAEEPLRYEDEVIGFVERYGESVQGTVRLDDTALSFVARDGRDHRWDLLDVRALQSSSSSIQLSVRGGAALRLDFPGDSPHRWEVLLQNVLSERWLTSGRGRIVEFQPRIVAR